MRLDSPIGKTEADSIVITTEDILTAINNAMEHIEDTNYGLATRELEKLANKFEDI